MRSNNLVILRGHLGSTPNGRLLPGGERVTQLSLATKHVYRTQDGERRERTDWHRIDVFGPTAEWAMNQMKKGDFVQVMGAIRHDVVSNATGAKTTYTTVRAHEVELLTRRPGATETAEDPLNPSPSAPPLSGSRPTNGPPSLGSRPGEGPAPWLPRGSAPAPTRLDLDAVPF